MTSRSFTGGEKLEAKLREMAQALTKPGVLRVGFLENSTYADGTPTAMIAAIQEFGARIEVEPGENTIYRKVTGDGSFAKNGRFVKKKNSNFATTHYVGAHVINIPPRPFFRKMVMSKSPKWASVLGDFLALYNYNAPRALGMMGEVIKAQLLTSIDDLTSPPLAASTIQAKGNAKPLVDTGHLLMSVDAEVTE